MNAKEAKVVAGAKSRYDQSLFGFGRCRFFDDRLNGVEIVSALKAFAADGAKIQQKSLACRLYC